MQRGSIANSIEHSANPAPPLEKRPFMSWYEVIMSRPDFPPPLALASLFASGELGKIHRCGAAPDLHWFPLTIPVFDELNTFSILFCILFENPCQQQQKSIPGIPPP